MKKKIITFFILFIILSNSISFSFYSTLPIWTESDAIETSNTSSENFITLESESAILIEQTTRQSAF